MKLVTTTIFLCCFPFMSCKHNCKSTETEIKSLMKEWYKKKIVFPPDMEFLVDSSFTNPYYLSNNSQLKKQNTIVHFFTADCDKCVNELKTIQTSLAASNEAANISYMFIASAPTKTYVLDAMSKIKFPYPIYYEKRYYSFKTLNKLPLQDDLYNTMLINKNQEVILFGAFYDNKKAERLYLEANKCGL